MKCVVCGKDFSGSRCPVCDFPVIKIVEDSEAEQRKRRELAVNYRRKKLEKASLSLRVYANELQGDEVRVKEESDIVLASGEALTGNADVWYPESFARQAGNPCVTVSVVNTDGTAQTRTVEMKNPGTEDFWHVGVRPEPGFTCRLLLGTRERNTVSEPFSFSSEG